MSIEKLNELKNAAIEAEGIVENFRAELSALESAEEVDKDAVKAKKAEVKKAETALKKASTAVTKEEAKQAKEAEKADCISGAEKLKAEKKAKAEEAKAKKQAEKEAKQKEREANRMPEQNGIRRPKPNTLCGQAWGLADELSAKFGQPTPIKELLEAAEKAGLNAGNVKAEYARWRAFNGVTGRVTLPKAEAEAPAEETSEA